MTTTYSHTNNRWLNHKGMKERLRPKLNTAEKKIDYLKLKIQESNLRLGITVDNELDEGLGLIIWKQLIL